MKGKSRRRVWLRLGLGAAAIALYAVAGGSAGAAVIGAGPVSSARIATARAAAATPGVVLGGFTSQQYPVFFRIAPNGRMVTVGAIAISLNCTSGSQPVNSDLFTRVHINAQGRMNAASSQPPTAGPTGATYTWTDSLTARLNRKHTLVSGVWRLAVNFSFTNGMSDECDSGPVRFVAAAG